MLFLGAAITMLFYLTPEVKRFNILREEIENWNNISAELDSLIQNRNVFIDTINTISREDLSRIDNALPEGAHSSDFLALLENLSVKHGLILRRVDLASFTQPQIFSSGTGAQPKPSGIIVSVKEQSSLKEFPLHLTVSGTYDAFKTFLADLEKNTRLIDVQEVSFTAPGKTNISDFNIKAKTYYQ